MDGQQIESNYKSLFLVFCLFRCLGLCEAGIGRGEELRNIFLNFVHRRSQNLFFFFEFLQDFFIFS